MDDLYGLGNYFWSDTVPGNNSDAFLLAHGLEDYQLPQPLSFRYGMSDPKFLRRGRTERREVGAKNSAERFGIYVLKAAITSSAASRSGKLYLCRLASTSTPGCSGRNRKRCIPPDACVRPAGWAGWWHRESRRIWF